jgi:hypothetical protein
MHGLFPCLPLLAFVTKYFYSMTTCTPAIKLITQLDIRISWIELLRVAAMRDQEKVIEKWCSARSSAAVGTYRRRA